MAVSLSLFAGAGAQFFDNTGLPLAGGLLYTYAAGTTTPAGSYTDYTGTILNPNPIILDGAGRVPNEIWLTVGSTYKFVLQTSAAVQIGSWDQISGAANSSSLSGGAANQIVYQSATGVTSFVTAPTTASTFLEWTGSAFAWATSGTGTANNIAGGAANQILYQTGSGATSFLSAPTTSNTYLQWTGSAFTWAASTSGGPSLTANQTWTGSNVFAGSTTSGGAGTTINGSNNSVNSAVFQCYDNTYGQKVAFQQYAYGGNTYGIIGGGSGLIINLGSSEPGTELVVINGTGTFPYTSNAYSLGTSSNLWSTVYASTISATTGNFTGYVSGTWDGNAVGVNYGGTGLTSVGASGNVLTSNGTTWVSSPPSGGGGGVTSITANSPLSASASTGAVTLSISGVPTLSANNTWTGVNTFTSNEVSTYSGGISAPAFQVDVSGTLGAALFQETYGSSTYAVVAGNGGTILGYGTSEPGTYVAVADANGFYPNSAGTGLLGTSSKYWGGGNFGGGNTSSFASTIFSQATGSNGIAMLTYAPSGTESNWDAVIGSSSEGLAYFSVGSLSSPTSIGSITYNGTSTVYGTTSDRRLKDNIANLPAGTGLAKIQALTPRSFTWKHNNNADVGFIADEVQAVVPGAVSGTPTDTRKDGSIKPQNVDPSLLVVHLVQAVQEMAAEIATLKAKVGV